MNSLRSCRPPIYHFKVANPVKRVSTLQKWAFRLVLHTVPSMLSVKQENYEYQFWVGVAGHLSRSCRPPMNSLRSCRPPIYHFKVANPVKRVSTLQKWAFRLVLHTVPLMLSVKQENYEYQFWVFWYDLDSKKENPKLFSLFCRIFILLSRESDQSAITSLLRSCQPSVYHT